MRDFRISQDFTYSPTTQSIEDMHHYVSHIIISITVCLICLVLAILCRSIVHFTYNDKENDVHVFDEEL